MSFPYPGDCVMYVVDSHDPADTQHASVDAMLESLPMRVTLDFVKLGNAAPSEVAASIVSQLRWMSAETLWGAWCGAATFWVSHDLVSLVDWLFHRCGASLVLRRLDLAHRSVQEAVQRCARARMHAVLTRQVSTHQVSTQQATNGHGLGVIAASVYAGYRCAHLDGLSVRACPCAQGFNQHAVNVA
jgi:hypothetical protein